MKSDEAIKVLRDALTKAQYAIKGREHTGFIDAALSATEAIEPASAGVPEGIRRLARRCLWLAYAWNDHNFDAAHVYAREEAQNVGINSLEDAEKWLAATVPPVATVASVQDDPAHVKLLTDIMSLKVKNPHEEDNVGLWSMGFRSAQTAIATLVDQARAAQSTPVPPSVQVPDIKPFAYCIIDGDDREYNTIDEFSGRRSNGLELYTAAQVQALLDERRAALSCQSEAQSAPGAGAAPDDGQQGTLSVERIVRNAIFGNSHPCDDSYLMFISEREVADVCMQVALAIAAMPAAPIAAQEPVAWEVEQYSPSMSSTDGYWVKEVVKRNPTGWDGFRNPRPLVYGDTAPPAPQAGSELPPLLSEKRIDRIMQELKYDSHCCNSEWPVRFAKEVEKVIRGQVKHTLSAAPVPDGWRTMLAKVLATADAKSVFAKLDDGQGTETGDGVVWMNSRAALAAARQAPQPQQPMTMSYVQDVPDQCDRIVWRGAYYHLRQNVAPQAVAAPDRGSLADNLRIEMTDNGRWVVCVENWFPNDESARAACRKWKAAYSDAPPIKVMVDRFLGWPLPKTFGPDCGISFDGRKDEEWNTNKPWPIGTNLLTADEATAMFAHCLKSPSITQPSAAPAAGASFCDGSEALAATEKYLADAQAAATKQLNSDWGDAAPADGGSAKP